MKINKIGLKKIFRNILLLSIALAFILIEGCKKYPDGPLISLRSVKHRLAGTWDVEYFSINGNDSTSYLKSKYYYGMYALFQKHDSHVCTYLLNDPNYTLRGDWQLIDNKSRKLGIYFFPWPGYSEHLGPYRASAEWEIRRLTEKEMWLKTIYNDGREYFVKFKLFKNDQ